uniref:RNA-directed DNA polymerase n=1 Tax=Sipha flava TaxID=143950 RepID=A0A2S2QGJ3_9HEMI
MCIAREQPQLYQTRNIKIGKYTFEKVQSFKYLVTELNSQNNNHEEIKKRVEARKRCLHALSKCLYSKLLSKKSKKRLYKIIARPIITYACEIWPTMLKDERKLSIVERKFLRKICGPKINNITSSVLEGMRGYTYYGLP